MEVLNNASKFSSINPVSSRITSCLEIEKFDKYMHKYVDK